MLSDRHTSMFGSVLILNILQNGLLVLGSIGCLILRINIHSLFPLSKRSQLLKWIEDMCRNEKHACCWSHFSIVSGQLLSSELHSKEQVFLPGSLHLSQSLHHTVHMIEHVIVHCNNLMPCDCMPHWPPQGPMSKWPLYFHDILHSGPLILSNEKWPIISVFSMLQHHRCGFL